MQNRFRTGMTVFSSDGEKLGKIVRLDGSTAIIEKGFFFPIDYACRVENIESVRGEDEVVLRLSRAELETGAGATLTNERTAGGRGVSERTEQPRAAASTSRQEDVSIPVVEEQVQVTKRARQKGQVKITKSVVEEQKQMTVPVLREEVRVERVPADGTAATGARFENDSVTVPVMEEQVEVTKRPVVKEEVRVSKTAHVDQRSVDATVRREEVDVKEDDDGDTRTSYAEDEGSTSHV
jgi:uncharacterized protein (TIGR02271 family)